MSDAPPEADDVIYEVALEADAEIAGPFDTWLRDHVADMLALPGFLAAEILSDEGTAPGRVSRVVHYRLRDQAALDAYLRDHAPRMRAHGAERFGSRYSAERRVLAHRERFTRGAVSTENCLNCGEVLTGQHCSHCGQRARVRVLSLWGLTKDVLGDLIDWDSRVWRTLRPLAFRPGLLTLDFLRGRRMNYTPPFRMYLILSVAFFLLASLGNDPGGSLRFSSDESGTNLQLRDGGGAGDEGPAGTGAAASGSRVDATPPAAPASPGGPAAPATPAAAARHELDPDAQRFIDRVVQRLPEQQRTRTRTELETEISKASPEELASVNKALDDPCSEENIRVDIGPLGDRYEQRLRDACNRIVSDTPSYGRALYENIPKMMFIFLPLIGLVLYVLYLGSGRYYVEHLLFVVHYHAFFFLGGIAILLLERLATATEGGGPGRFFSAAGDLTIAAFVLYAPYYLYRAMRRVYGQGRIVTLAKYGVLGVAYLVSMALTAVGLLAYTALTM